MQISVVLFPSLGGCSVWVCGSPCFPVPASVTGCFYFNDRYTSLPMHDKKFPSLCVAYFTDLEVLGQQPIECYHNIMSSFSSNTLVNQLFFYFMSVTSKVILDYVCLSKR